MKILTDDEYMQAVSDAILNHWCIPAPETRSQLQRLIISRPDIARRFLPGRAELWRLGISTNACRDVPPLPIEIRERLLKTLATDADFRGAVRSLIGGAA